MSEENKDLEEVVEEETEEKAKPKKSKKVKSKKEAKEKVDIDFNKIIKDTFGTVRDLFTDSPARGMLIVQGVIGLLLLSVFIGGFIGKLIGIIIAVVGIIGVRALSAEFLDNDSEEGEDEDDEEKDE